MATGAANITQYTCAVTYQVQSVALNQPPGAGWFALNTIYYHPLAIIVMSLRVATAFNAQPSATLTLAQIIAPAHAAELTLVGLPIPNGVT